MGMYASLKGKLKKKEEPRDETWERIQARRKELEKKLKTKEAFTAFYRSVREKRAVLEADDNVLSVDERAAMSFISEYMQREKLSSFKDEEGFLFYEESTPTVAVVDEEKAEDWLRENGLGHVWKIHPGSLAKEIKQRLLDGEEVPEYFDVSMFTKIKMKKGA